MLKEPGRMAALGKYIRATKQPAWEAAREVKNDVLVVIGGMVVLPLCLQF